MSIPNLNENTPLMVSSFTISSFWSGLTVLCSKDYNSGSNWNFQKILSDSERCIFPLLLTSLWEFTIMARSRLVAVKGLNTVVEIRYLLCHYQ